jgi:hypothetical protein
MLIKTEAEVETLPQDLVEDSILIHRGAVGFKVALIFGIEVKASTGTTTEIIKK